MNLASIALSVADDIERLGHWRLADPPPRPPLNSPVDPDTPCCVIRNPTMNSLRHGDDLDSRPLAYAFDSEFRHYLCVASLAEWSDENPASKVISTLREFAAYLSATTKDSA